VVDGDELAPALGARAPPPPSPAGSVTEIASPAGAGEMPLAVALESDVLPDLDGTRAPAWRVVAAAATRWPG
jgi:hypothetical protein